MKTALLVGGGWPGHKPEQFLQLFQKELEARGFRAETSDTLDRLNDAESLKTFDLIFPFWTMGALTPEQGRALQDAIRSGVGLGGLHGGAGDAFRGNLDFEWMVGGHFVGHPYVGDYTVTVRDAAHPIMAGMPASFPYNSEQYYMLVDPGVHILADSEYTYEGRTCTMPIAWTKQWGEGRVFYSALGHDLVEFEQQPLALELAMRGLLWAAKAL
jgi:type 1 glutamine amidotransferase